MIEPVLICLHDHQDLIEQCKARVKAVSLRRDKWNSIEDVSVWMRDRYPWKTWDSRIFDLHLKHGFKMVADGVGRQMVTTKCPKAQESLLYTHEPHLLAGQQLHEICSQIPVHAIFAESDEFVPAKARKAVCNSTEGRVMSSISIIPESGHLVVQEKPEAIASAIFRALFAQSRL